MNKNSEEDIIIPRGEHAVEIEVFPFGPFFARFRKDEDFTATKDALICSLLSKLRSFNTYLVDVREKIGLEDFLDYPEEVGIETLIRLVSNFFSSTESYELFEKEIDAILHRYSLGENWRLSIKTAILTNHLPIPLPLFAINSYIPVGNPKTLDEIKNLANKQIVLSVKRSEIVRYPAIYFTSQITETELIRWIRNNKDLIPNINSNLPKETNVALRFNKKTQVIGSIATILKQEGVTSWKEMERILETIDDEIPPDEQRPYGDYAPTAEDLKTCYDSYIDTLKRLDMSSEI